MQDLCAMSLKEIFSQDLCERSLGLGLLARSLCILLVKISAQDLLDGISAVPQQERSDTHITKVGQTLENPRTTRRQRCCKFPATFVKTAFFMRLSRLYDYMRLLGCGSHAFRIFIRKKCATCSEGKTPFFFHVFFFMSFSHFFLAFFTVVAKKTKHVKTVTWTCNIFPRLATFGHGMRLLSQSQFFPTTWFPRYAKHCKTTNIVHLPLKARLPSKMEDQGTFVP